MDGELDIDLVPGLCTLTKYPKEIQAYYESSSSSSATRKTTTDLSQLSPRDFYDKWNADELRKEQPNSVIINIAPSVVSVSLFYGVQRRFDCSGLIIQWNDSSSTATVLTSAKIIRIAQVRKRDDHYIVVRLLNGKILLAEEDYVDYYHNIITLKVSSDVKLKPVEMPPAHVEIEIGEGVDVVAVGRNFYTCSLSESNGIVHKDYPYFGCELLASSTCVSSQFGEGGPLITRMGDVCGINFFDGHKRVHPLPIRALSACLEKWTCTGLYVNFFWKK